ncbi:MAG: DUF488 domain-containing protein [Pirellulaceae bacterium]
MTQQTSLCTIGHGNHAWGHFLWLLRKYEIHALVDVRRYPRSRPYPHFNRSHLSASLENEGIAYHWLEALGGNRKQAQDASPSLNRGLENERFRNYADYAAEEPFQEEVRKLLVIVNECRTAIMCAEADYRRRHRRLISDYLLANGITVCHILANGERTPHQLTRSAKIARGMVTYPGPPTLINVRRSGSKAKPYQVRQFHAVMATHGLGGQEWCTSTRSSSTGATRTRHSLPRFRSRPDARRMGILPKLLSRAAGKQSSCGSTRRRRQAERFRPPRADGSVKPFGHPCAVVRTDGPAPG